MCPRGHHWPVIPVGGSLPPPLIGYARDPVHTGDEAEMLIECKTFSYINFVTMARAFMPWS